METPKPTSIVDLSKRRETLIVPTNLATFLATAANAELTLVRPGLIEAMLPSGERTVIKVSRVNIFEREAEAYLLQGKPIPEKVLQDIQNWRKQNGDR